MYRLALSRTASIAFARANHTFTTKVALPSLTHGARKNSTKPKSEIKKQLEAQDDLRRDWDARILTYEELKPRTEQPTTEKYLIDVREPDEVLQGSIPSSVNLPLSVLSNALHMDASSFRDKFGFEKPRLDQEVAFYCRSGQRSATACDVAKRNGYTNLANYRGSWLEWVSREGNKTTPV